MQYKRQFRIMRSVLEVSKKTKVSTSPKTTGYYLLSKGFINQSGRITPKGREAIKVLKKM